MSFTNCITRKESVEKIHKCNICEEIFLKRIDLKRHYHEHGNRRAYQCDICGQTFSKKFNFRRHYNIHSNEKPYACDKCDQRFRWPSFLKEHENKHLMNKLFVCESCNVTFTHRTTLRNHMLTHTGEKPHMCDICGKRFSKNYNLKLHRRLHTGELPFQCEHCDRCFNTKSNLKNHSYHHTGIYPFICDVCEKGFRKKCKLLSHYDVHVKSSVNTGSATPVKNISNMVQNATVKISKPNVTVKPLPHVESDVDDPKLFVTSEPRTMLPPFKNFEAITSSTYVSMESVTTSTYESRPSVMEELTDNNYFSYNENESNKSSSSVISSTSNSLAALTPEQRFSPIFNMESAVSESMGSCIKSKPYESLEPFFEMESLYSENHPGSIRTSEILDSVPLPVSIKIEARGLTPTPVNGEPIVNIDSAMKSEPFITEDSVLPGTPLKVSHPASVMSLWNLESNVRPDIENVSSPNVGSKENARVQSVITTELKTAADTELQLNHPASVKCNLGIFESSAKFVRSLNFDPIDSECTTMNAQENTFIKYEPYMITELPASKDSPFHSPFSEKSLNSPERTFNFFTSIKLEPIDSS